MLIKQLTIYNYRTFYRENSFNFLTHKEKPIILVGGRNGCGKTSILDAVKICLYGSLNDDIWNPKEAYPIYLYESLNHRARQESDREIYFTCSLVTESGLEKTIKRQFEIDIQRKKIKQEVLHIFEGNNNITAELSDEDKQDYIDNILPYNISRFFLFDGEKIKTFADDLEYKSSLLGGIKDLLNINIHHTLRSDVLDTQKSLLREIKDGNIQQQLGSIDTDKSARLDKIENLTREKDFCIREKSDIEGELETITNDLKRKGYYNQSEIDKIENEISEKEKEIERLRDEQRGYLKEEYPLIILRELIGDFLVELERENEIEIKQKSIKELKLHEKYEHIRDGIDSYLTDTIRLESLTRNKLLDYFEIIWTETFNITYKEFTTRFRQNISDAQIGFIRNIMKQTEKSPLKQLIRKIISLQSEKDRLKRKLRDIPQDNTFFDELIKKRDDYISKLTICGQRIKEIDVEIKENEKAIKEIDNRIDKLKDKLNDVERLKDIYKLSSAVVDVLDSYTKELISLKASELKDILYRVFTQISAKGQEIKELHVNDDFSIELTNTNNQRIAKDKLSSGEKQLLAVSLLYSLATISKSNRKLFMIIDTPMGRLDDVHRDNLIKEFFPHASEQVIILSTPEEIDFKYYKDLNKYLSASYILNYHLNEFVTDIEEGYFEFIKER